MIILTKLLAGYRGIETYRPVLCFIDETREYLLCKLLKGETLSGKEAASFIKKIKGQLHGCVKKVLFRVDGEFFSWDSISATVEVGFDNFKFQVIFSIGLLWKICGSF